MLSSFTSLLALTCPALAAFECHTLAADALSQYASTAILISVADLQ
jgi:hypothetical protein